MTEDITKEMARAIIGDELTSWRAARYRIELRLTVASRVAELLPDNKTASVDAENIKNELERIVANIGEYEKALTELEEK